MGLYPGGAYNRGGGGAYNREGFFVSNLGGLYPGGAYNPGGGGLISGILRYLNGPSQ